MRGWTIIIFCFFFASPAALAEPELHLGIKAGGDSATFATQNRIGRYGGSIGAYSHLQWRLTTWLYVSGQAELLYTGRGAKTVFQGDVVALHRLHYADIVMAARPTFHYRWASAYLLMGAELNLLARAFRVDCAGQPLEGCSSLSEFDVTDAARSRYDVSFLGGIGFGLRLPEWQAGPFRLETAGLEARYERGLIPFDKIDDRTFKNRTTSLLLGVTFAIETARPAPVPPPDADDDGVLDRDDQCPDELEDGQGELPDDGCPTPPEPDELEQDVPEGDPPEQAPPGPEQDQPARDPLERGPESDRSRGKPGE